MAEVSLVKQLSGTEALESMMYELRKVLQMNGRFQPHMAYSGYRAEITVKFYPAQSLVPPVEQEIEVASETFTGEMSLSPTVNDTVDIPVRSPNQTREDANMPTPVLTMEDGQPVEKWVKRKNTFKGGKTGPAQTMVPTMDV